MKTTTALILVWVASFTGCGQGSDEPLDAFKQRWHHAASRQAHEELYDMLDSASKRRIGHDLEIMRGLDVSAQRAVLVQLGQHKIKTLKDLTPRHYFALLWQQATGGKQPKVDIAPNNLRLADMVMTFENGKRLLIRLTIEGGVWVWGLPNPGGGSADEKEPIVW